DRLSGRPSPGPAQGRRGGRGRARVLRVVAAGQLRVGGGVRAPVRAGARRLRDAAADAEVVVRLVPGCAAGAEMTATRPTEALAEPVERVGRGWTATLSLANGAIWVGWYGPLQILLASQAKDFAPGSGMSKETM